MSKILILSQTRFKNVKDLNLVKKFIQQSKGIKNSGDLSLIVNHQQDYFSNLTTEVISNNILILKSNLKTLSEARNLLIDYSLKKISKFDYMFFVDDDVYVEDLINLKMKIYNAKKKFEFDFGSASILVKNKRKTFSRNCKWALDFKYPFLLNKFHHNMVLGSAIILRKEIVNNIRFDSLLGLGAKYGGSEDTDLFFQAIYNNYKCIYLPDVIVRHPEILKNQYNFSIMFKYGLGRGFVYRKFFSKDPLYMIFSYFYSTMRNFLGVIIFLLKLDFEKSIRQLGLALGKILGFLKLI